MGKDFKEMGLNQEFDDVSGSVASKSKEYSGLAKLGIVGGSLTVIYGVIGGTAMLATGTTPSNVTNFVAREIICAPILKNPSCPAKTLLLEKAP